MRFTNVFLLDLPKCLWSVSQCRPPECVAQDTDSVYLLSCNCILPMDRVSGHEHLEYLVLSFHMNYLKLSLFTLNLSCEVWQRYCSLLLNQTANKFISLLCCGIHIYMRSILYHSEWMLSFVLYQFVIKIWYLLIWLNMGYGSKEPVKEARRSLQTMDISNGSIWTSDIFSTHDKSLIWTIYIEILSPESQDSPGKQCQPDWPYPQHSPKFFLSTYIYGDKISI